MKKHFINALIKFILFSATLHILLLLIFFVFKRDLTLINYFNIIGLNLFFPEVGQGLASQIFSLLTMVVIYGLIFFVSSRKQTTNN